MRNQGLFLCPKKNKRKKSAGKIKNCCPYLDIIILSSPTMHGDELKYVTEAYETNWMSTVGKNINEVERLIAERVGVRYAVALSAGTASLHLAMKLAGEAMYGQPEIEKGALSNKKIFCSDVTFDATVNPVVYEGGIPVFIDTERDTWNMDPVALEKAFEIYPDVKVIVVAHLYGTPGKIDEIKKIYSYNNGLAEGSVNKIKVIKRVMYGRNSFELLKAKVLFGELFHVKFN